MSAAGKIVKFTNKKFEQIETKYKRDISSSFESYFFFIWYMSVLLVICIITYIVFNFQSISVKLNNIISYYITLCLNNLIPAVVTLYYIHIPLV